MKCPLGRVEIDEELDGSGVVVADTLDEFHRGVAECVPQRVVETDGGRDLHHFLVAALDRAIAFVKVKGVSVLVAHYLHFDVLGAGDVAFEEDRGVSKGALGFALRFIEQVVEGGGILDDSHPAPAATEGGLDNEGKSDFLGDFDSGLTIAHRVLRAWERGETRLVRGRSRRHLVTHEFEDLGARPHEDDAGLVTGAGELGVFR